MLTIGLLIITLTGSGEARMSITDTPSLAACEQTRATIIGVLKQRDTIGVLKQRDTTVLEARCASSNLLISPYAHGSKDNDYRYYYQVTLSGTEDYKLQYHGEDSSCEKLKTTKSNLCLVASQPPRDEQ